MKPICVVICNFNKQDFVLGAIASVKQTAADIADILVVDNASTDHSVAMIRSQFPDIRLDELPNNIGGSGGFAHGMREAQLAGYRYIALLDNDAVVLPGTLAGMMTRLDGQDDIGVVGPAICKMDTPEMVQEVGANVLLEDSDFHLNYLSERYSAISAELQECDYVPACCLMTTGAVIAQVGVFDEHFFLYWDDIDWCVRVKDAGWRVVADPLVCALHKGGGANATNTIPRYYYWRNKLRFFYKHPQRYPAEQICTAITRDLARRVTFLRLNGMDELLMALRQGIDDAVDGIWGRYMGEVFPDRGNGKRQLLNSMIPSGHYHLDFSAVMNSKMPASRKMNSLCRFITSCSQFATTTHTFSITTSALPAELLSRVVSWPAHVMTTAMPATVATKHLTVFPHLFDAESLKPAPNEVVTDLFWNLIPQTVSGDTCLTVATEIDQLQRQVQHFLCRRKHE